MGKTLARFLGGLFILGATSARERSAWPCCPSAAATVITVNDASDSSPVPGDCITSPETDCTLRAALEEATVLNQAVTIDLPDPATVLNNPGAFYSVSGNEIDITDTGGTVTIAPTGTSHVSIQATSGTRVLEIGNYMLGGVVADISGVTISNGNAPSFQGSDCGGICVSSSNSKLTLTNSTVSDNTAGTLRRRHRAVPTADRRP